MPSSLKSAMSIDTSLVPDAAAEAVHAPQASPLPTTEFPHPIRAVIFDLDGTLIDYETISHVALKQPLITRKLINPESEDSYFDFWALHGSIVGCRFPYKIVKF